MLRLGPHCHYWRTNSTTMTFATLVKTIRDDNDEVMAFFSSRERHPDDFDLWLTLSVKGKHLASTVPGCSTHGETALLSPCVDWTTIGGHVQAMVKGYRIHKDMTPTKPVAMVSIAPSTRTPPSG